MQFTPYALPAIVALLAKVAMFFYARYAKVHNLQTRLFLLFLFSLSIQNVAEIRFFVVNTENLHAVGSSGWVWYSATILAIAFMVHLSLVTATRWRDDREALSFNMIALIYAPAVALQILLWATDWLVAGFERMSYTVTQIPGPLYFLFRLYAILYLCAAIGLLLYGCKAAETAFRRLQNKFLLIGLSPIVLLSITILTLRYFDFRTFNATGTLPFAVTLFLATTAYATHQHRLFDIALFIPWSKVRKRKTAFYERIKAVIAEIADMTSVNKIVRCLSEVLRCPVVLIGGPRPALAMAGEAFGIARFPVDELKKIDQITVAHEIADANPLMYGLMRRHKIAAIVPFHPHSEAAASWLLLGDSFSEHVHTPHDFQAVEVLFARLADYFLDKQILLRSQLSEAKQEMGHLQERLANAWQQMETVKKQHKVLEEENHRLWQIVCHEIRELELQLIDEAATGKRTLDEYTAEFEAHLIEKVLRHCDGDRERVGELLGLSPYTLHHKMVRYGLAASQKEGQP